MQQNLENRYPNLKLSTIVNYIYGDSASFEEEFNSSENEELTAIARAIGTGINRTPRNEHNANNHDCLMLTIWIR